MRTRRVRWKEMGMLPAKANGSSRMRRKIAQRTATIATKQPDHMGRRDTHMPKRPYLHNALHTQDVYLSRLFRAMPYLNMRQIKAMPTHISATPKSTQSISTALTSHILRSLSGPASRLSSLERMPSLV